MASEKFRSARAKMNVASTNTISLLDQLWEALHGNLPRSELIALAHSAEITSADADLWSHESPRSEIIPVWNDETLTQSNQALLNLKLNPAAVKRCAVDNLAFEAEKAVALGRPALADLLLKHCDAARLTFQNGFLNTITIYERAHQHTAFAEGVVFCPCPFTGIPLESTHSFVVAVDVHKQTYILYRFEGHEPFYLAVSSWVGYKSFLYLPRHEIALQLGHPGYNWGDAQPAIAGLKRLVVRRSIAVHDYLQAATRPAALLGTMNNLGHFFWNEVSGLTQLRALGLTNKLQAAVIYRFAFIDPVKFLNQEKSLEIHRPETPEAMFDTGLERRLFCVRPTGLRIDTTTVAGVRQAAESALTSSVRTRMAEAREADLVIWFNLRAHNKSWQEQAAGAVAVAKRAKADGFRLSLYLDGTPDCQMLADDIRAGVPEQTAIYEGLKVSMEESIAWAFSCDAYVATIGSGLTLVTWIAGKRGVAHSERSHMNQLAFWAEVRPDVPQPRAPKLDDITDLGLGMYCNYSIDPNVIVDLLFSCLTPVKLLVV